MNFFFWKERKNNDTPFPSYQLRNYQLEDIKFLIKSKNSAIFNEVRTGKTAIALLTWKSWRRKNLLIVTPNILQFDWERSVSYWINQFSYIVSYLTEEDRFFFYDKLLTSQEWVIIISKERFKLDYKKFHNLRKEKGGQDNFDVIVDEGHFLRNYTSMQSKSVFSLSYARHKLVLTGTPFVNHHSDVFGILKFLEPSKYKHYWTFVERYFLIYNQEIVVNKRTITLKKVGDFKSLLAERIFYNDIKKISVFRKQKDVLPWLPRIIYREERMLMEKEQETIYSDLLRNRKDCNPLELLSKLITVTLYPRLLGSSKSGSKIAYLISYLKEWREQPTIIFSNRSSTFLIPLAKTLTEEKIDNLLITGDNTSEEKELAIKQFQNGRSNVLLCNIKTTSLGLNLSRGETAIFADRSFIPADNEQAETRFLPANNEQDKRPRLVIDLVCKGSVDEKIRQLLKKKESVTNILKKNPNYFFS